MMQYESKHIYYNVTIQHTPFGVETSVPSKAIYQETRTEAIFDGRPSDYYLSVVRFSVPTGYVPTMIFPIFSEGGDPNLGLYSVTLSYGGSDFQTRLIYTPENTFDPVPPPPVPTENSVRTKYVNYYSVYSLQHLVDMINIALTTSFNNLKAAFPAAPPTTPPFFSYNPTNKLFSLIASSAYAGPGTIEIYNNAFLNTLFETAFNVLYINHETPFGKDVLYIIENLFTNNVTLPIQGLCYVSTQDFTTVPSLSSFAGIVFQSGTLQIRPEWLSSNAVGTLPPPSTQQSSGANFQRILTDFELDQLTGFETKSSVHYAPTAEYRRIDLYGNDPIVNIDLQVYWRDKQSNLYPIDIPFGAILTAKFLFERKQLLTAG